MTSAPTEPDTGEEGTAAADPERAADIGAGFRPDDAVEGEAIEQVNRDAEYRDAEHRDAEHKD